MNVHSSRMMLTVAGEQHAILSEPGRRLSEVLRDDLGLKSVKIGCDAGDCGACTVLIDGRQHCACLTPVAQVAGRRVETVETADPALMGRLQKAFLAHGAAQCGICTPGVLMASMELLQNNQKPDIAEIEDTLAGVLCRCTGYRKIISAIMAVGSPIEETVAPVAGKAVGHPVPRLDGVRKVDGTEIFGADYAPEGSLAVRAIRSPYHHARFELGDIVQWQIGHPGISAVVTAADIEGENRFGVIPPLADQPAIAEEVTRYRGEPVALIVGDPELVEAMDLENFPVTWTALPHSLTQAEGGMAGAPQLHETRSENTLIRGRVASGDPDQAMQSAAHVASGSFETSYVEHAYIEPEAGAAWLDGDTLVIQACTQAPVMDRDDTAKVLGLPVERVRIIPSAAGGGFGSKLDITVQPLLGLAVLKTGRPCRMVFSRSESMRASTKRHPGTLDASIGADENGRITSMVLHGDFNTGAYASWGPTVATRVPVHASGPYLTPNYRATSRAIHTNGPTAGAFRGFGVPQAAICQEVLYDDLAGKCGIDRLEFRRLNALRDGDATPSGQVLQAVGIEECLDALKPHWDRALAEAAAHNETSPVLKRGIGVASCWYGCGNTALPNPSTIRIGITAGGTLKLHQGATDIGQGSNTVITQIAADALGVPLSLFELIGPDTALTPDCGKTSASRQTYISGKAAERSGVALRDTILRLTNLPETARIELGTGSIIVSHGDERREIDLKALPVNPDGYVLMAEETYDPPTTALDEDGQGTPYAVYGYGAQMAEVEVDLLLGRTRVIRITAAHDLGRVINPLLAEGQVEGGIAQGLGLALMEEFIPGRTENLHDYLIPTIGDMPEVQSIFIEKHDPEGPMGAKGLGEHVLIPTAPAILNAIRHASGARITKVPALPHRVLAAIKAAQ
ncbi:molybdopterin cofactor-binding domain-containing protein [uncultured Nisaea sp.]|uniref:molybdopterin-dependent oxidoreductase n=1 Tax=uncultured Nisaea sp. TaxID=538215 RepID=UPI0030EB7D2D